MPNPVTAPWILTGLTRLSGTVGLGFGAAFVLTPVGRFSGPSFQTMLAVPGAPASWGYALIVASLLTLVGSLAANRWAIKSGLVAITCWHFFFALSAGIYAASHPHAAITGVFAYGWLALVHAALAAVYQPRSRR